jgi:hypothetical protein
MPSSSVLSSLLSKPPCSALLRAWAEEAEHGAGIGEVAVLLAPAAADDPATLMVPSPPAWSMVLSERLAGRWIFALPMGDEAVDAASPPL